MENLIIKATRSTPEIFFSTTGELKMLGRFLTENAVKTFEPLIYWIKNFDGSSLLLDIELDYMNTSSTMLLFTLLKQIDEDAKIGNAIVNWHYERDDEDHLETGKFYEDKLEKIQFKYSVIEVQSNSEKTETM